MIPDSLSRESRDECDEISVVDPAGFRWERPGADLGLELGAYSIENVSKCPFGHVNWRVAKSKCPRLNLVNGVGPDAERVSERVFEFA